MFKAYVPQSMVEGYYKGEGRYNGLKIKSKGFFNITAGKLRLVEPMQWTQTHFSDH